METTAQELLQLHGGVGLAIGVLSRASNTAARCFQRATIHALAASVPRRSSEEAPQRWLELQGGGALLLRYVVSLRETRFGELAVERLASQKLQLRLFLGRSKQWDLKLGASGLETDTCNSVHRYLTKHRGKTGACSGRCMQNIGTDLRGGFC